MTQTVTITATAQQVDRAFTRAMELHPEQPATELEAQSILGNCLLDVLTLDGEATWRDRTPALVGEAAEVFLLVLTTIRYAAANDRYVAPDATFNRLDMVSSGTPQPDCGDPDCEGCAENYGRKTPTDFDLN